MSALLTVDGLHVAYGAIRAVRGVSLRVDAGQVVALVGANGAGKSTTLNALSGLLPPSAGRVTFDGVDITGWRADRVARLGLVQVPEGRQVIATMSVHENLLMGAQAAPARAAAQQAEAIYERFKRLRERRTQPAGSLSGGEQQMLAIGRALMAQPRLLMLDEPSMGLAPLLVSQVFALISEIKAAGTPIFLVEQNARKALQVADYAYVLERGQVAKEGPAEALQNDPAVVAAYLGGR